MNQSKLKKYVRYDPVTGIFYRGEAEAGWLSDNGYLYIGVDGTDYRASRLAVLYMTGAWPAEDIDHENQIKIDNRWENLRPISNAANQKNRPKTQNNTSGVTGVSWDKEANKWRASINIDGALKNLGRFVNKQKAIAVRKAAEVMYGYHPNHGK